MRLLTKSHIQRRFGLYLQFASGSSGGMRRNVARHRGQDRAKLHHWEDVLRPLSRYRFISETQSREEGSFKGSTKEGGSGLNNPRNKKRQSPTASFARLELALVILMNLNLVDDMVLEGRWIISGTDVILNKNSTSCQAPLSAL